MTKKLSIALFFFAAYAMLLLHSAVPHFHAEEKKQANHVHLTADNDHHHGEKEGSKDESNGLAGALAFFFHGTFSGTDYLPVNSVNPGIQKITHADFATPCPVDSYQRLVRPAELFYTRYGPPPLPTVIHHFFPLKAPPASLFAYTSMPA